MSQTKPRLVAGCMSGTSLDALDVSLVEIQGRALKMKAKPIRHHSVSLGKLAEPLRRLSEQEPTSIRNLLEISREYAHLHIRALKKLISKTRVDLVALHGQTLYHAPPLSFQLMNATPIAQALGIPCVHDLRAMDLACGGQGAPITPLADWILYADKREQRVIVNLGGFINLTTLPPSQGFKQPINKIGGYDLCTCNQLLNHLARTRLKTDFDKGGKCASKGKVDATFFKRLTRKLKTQGESGRSLGTCDEPRTWKLLNAQGLNTPDLLKSACAAIAAVLVDHLKGYERAILAGGGAHNHTLVEEIRSRAACQVDLSDELGIPTNYREACAMGVLGALCDDHTPITLPKVTRSKKALPLSGVWVRPV